MRLSILGRWSGQKALPAPQEEPMAELLVKLGKLGVHPKGGSTEAQIALAAMALEGENGVTLTHENSSQNVSTDFHANKQAIPLLFGLFDPSHPNLSEERRELLGYLRDITEAGIRLTFWNSPPIPPEIALYFLSPPKGVTAQQIFANSGGEADRQQITTFKQIRELHRALQTARSAQQAGG